MSFNRAENFRQICLGGSLDHASDGRCLLIGEVAQTHDGSLGQAHAFIDAIADSGADAVKFQTHIAAAESTSNEPWRVKFSPQDETRYDYWRRMEFSKEQWAGLKEHAESKGLLFLSSPFSREAFELLKDIGVSVWKIASGEVCNLPLLDQIIKTGRPIILSSGMSDWKELDAAVDRIQKSGNQLCILQCTTNYPCPPEKVGLNLIAEIRERYLCPAGLSDHSGEIFAGLAAAALGAEVLEVHVTLSREMFGPDVQSSVTTSELRTLASGIRSIEKMLANPLDKDTFSVDVAPLRQIFTKSLYSSSFIPEGTLLDESHLQFKKPGNGIPVSELQNVVGKRLRRNLEPGEMVLHEDLEL